MNNPRIPIIEIKAIGEEGYDFIDLTIEAPHAQHLEVRQQNKY
jgi:hypothetical protein